MLNLLLSNLSATIDIIALALILILALFGLIQGFTKTFFSLFGTAIALIIAISFSPTIINFLQNNFNSVSHMSDNVYGLVSNIFGKELMQLKLSEATATNLYSAGIGGVLVKIILSVKDNGSISQDATVSDVICPTFAYYILLIISVVILFIILKIIFRLISKIVKKAYKSKGIARLDRVLGVALGILHAIILSELFILIISILPFGFMQDLYSAIQSSAVASFLENINILGLLTDKLIDANIIDVVSKLLQNI